MFWCHFHHIFRSFSVNSFEKFHAIYYPLQFARQKILLWIFLHYISDIEGWENIFFIQFISKNKYNNSVFINIYLLKTSREKYFRTIFNKNCWFTLKKKGGGGHNFGTRVNLLLPLKFWILSSSFVENDNNRKFNVFFFNKEWYGFLCLKKISLVLCNNTESYPSVNNKWSSSGQIYMYIWTREMILIFNRYIFIYQVYH